KKDSRKSSVKYQVEFPFNWLDLSGNTYAAPNAKLIYYPQYPEVRFSGYLRGSSVSMSQWMSPEKMGRAEGRWLILGTGNRKCTYGFLAVPNSRISAELLELSMMEMTKVFFKLLTTDGASQALSSKDLLLQKLTEIWQLGWVSGQRMHPNGDIKPYVARNGGGYTLESLLGISSNGLAGPDYHGWEVKQFGTTKGLKPTTLMDHSPNGGFYKTSGIKDFIAKYGYPDKSNKPDRLNFGGIHKCGVTSSLTGLTMVMQGFDIDSQNITNAGGSIALLDNNGEVAASWGFEKLMNHWKSKHSKAVFVPSVNRKFDGQLEYAFGQNIELGTGASFTTLLSSISAQYVYYDPGLKWENVSQVNSTTKARHPLRVKHQHLPMLYDNYEILDLAKSSNSSS
ncbi:MAG: MvaI/BcnI family restriction endonuclease, partial [Gammaproteobacteria bacterium]|nr:MvaI/BcnI family restriction endonuclease [Gammaproteobacteria bacterium]